MKEARIRKRKTASASVEALAGSDSGRLAQLVRDDLVRPARRAVPQALIATPPPAPKRGASGRRALLDERRDGRCLVDRPSTADD